MKTLYSIRFLTNQRTFVVQEISKMNDSTYDQNLSVGFTIQLESGSFTLSAATLNLAHLSASIYEIPGICPTHFDLCDFTYSTLQLNYFNMA